MSVFHEHLPEDMHQARALPGTRPVEGNWLRVDDAYGGQMAVRRGLLETHRDQVLRMQERAGPAAEELLAEVSGRLPGLGFGRAGSGWICPDGVRVAPSGEALLDLGRLCQADFCLLERGAGEVEHVLSGAVLCFPASWSLSEKMGRPLLGIHAPVAEYDEAIGRRVQRLFDGVQVGRPLWRFNRLWYADAQLFQPRSEAARRDPVTEAGDVLRCERQVILRLPQTRAMVFAIHTYVLRRADVPVLT